MDGGGAPGNDLRRARNKLIARRLPRFAAVWLPAALAWCFVLHAEGLLDFPRALSGFVVQVVILVAARAICRKDPGSSRVLTTVMGACIVLGVTTTAVFVSAGGTGDFLAFTLLMLYLLAALTFMWGWRAELVLLGSTALVWALATRTLRFHVPPVELATAIGVGSFVALAIAEGAWRAFAVAFEHRANEEASRRELEASRNAYRDLAEQATELIFTADIASRLTYVNAAMARCLGEPESAILGQPLPSFLSGHPANQRLLELVDAAEPPVAPVQFEARTIYGLRWFEAEPSPVRDASGRPVGMQAICRDVTDRKHLERERDAVVIREHAARVEAQAARIEAEATAQARDRFLAMLSHELRSPLGSILTWTRMLRRGLVEENRVPFALASMEQAATALERLVSDLLDISRIAAGKFNLQLERVNLVALLAARADAARAEAAAKNIRVEDRLDPAVRPVRADPTRLGQVFENLLSNAVKFTPAGGRITVTLESAHREAIVTVRDTGIGIAGKMLAHVFDEFQQADPSITRRYGGLGLGLAIARRLVEAHAGRIEAESDGEGMGATFRVRLPIVDAAVAQVETRRPEQPKLARLEGVRVLVVEDDPDAREVVTTLLSRYGANVRPAASVGEAVENVVQAQPDVVVADIAMPGEDGYALVRRLRAMDRERGGHLPVIAVTALASDHDRERAMREGFDEHLAKPVDPADLLDAVARRVRA
ncbi:MAG TPA: ATP-binding protein [Candidatus Binatia bacterium]|nr:ATP-binding protein [Candidatus Binatia bacterium]